MEIVKGNLITLAQEGHFDIITHGCNCFCNMGSGIAPQIKQAFPEAWEADRRTIKGAEGKLGCISVGEHELANGSNILIVNSYTQFNYGGGKVHVNYGALRSCFQKIYKLAENFGKLINLAEDGPVRIGYPKIGAGLAGGDWDLIKEIIEEELDAEFIKHTLVEYVQNSGRIMV